MAEDASKLGRRIGVLTPRWIRLAMLTNIAVVAVCFYAAVASDAGAASVAGTPVVVVLLPSVVLGFWLPRQGARVGITLHADGLSLRSNGELVAIPLADVDTIRWDDEPPTLVLDADRELPLPAWLRSDPRAQGGLERHLRRASPPT